MSVVLPEKSHEQVTDQRMITLLKAALAASKKGDKKTTEANIKTVLTVLKNDRDEE